MLKKSFALVSFVFALILSTSQAIATTNSTAVEENPDIGALFPVVADIVTGKAEGKQFVSVASDIGESFKAGTNPTFQRVESPFTEWSYSRGIGTIPSTCPSGTTNIAGLCAENCPAGYSSVAGVCWQHCPSGYTDHGATCTLWKWFPHTISKHSYIQPRTLPQCADGQVNEAGLCYTPCASTFVGVGALCFGVFGGAEDQARIRDQASQQHQETLDSLGQGGIVVGENQTPKLKTDMSFAPIVCGIANTAGAFGLPLPGADELGGTAVDAIGGAIIGAASGDSDSSAWFVPSLSETVLFDFSMDATCEDDGVIAKAGLNFNPSITVQASTRMFDSALHNLAGVDLGIMSVSVYELIPFRVYGTVGTTLGADVTVSSTINRDLPPVIINEKQHAHVTALDVVPEMDFWLSVEAYLRVTSILSFIPDLVQLGAEFKLFILELALPYSLEEGVRDASGTTEIYKKETLRGDLSSGRGYVDTFLKVLGIKTNAFGDDADVAWEGYKTNKTFIDTEESAPLAQ